MRHIAVIGASGAIGQAFVENYNDQPNTFVHAFSRKKISDEGNIKYYQVDFLADDRLSNALDLAIRLDKVIIATGILQDNHVSPEKKYQELEQAQLQHYFTVNTIMPILAAKQFVPYLRREMPSVMAFLSARVGSISDNRLGGWYGYRASKSALNMLIKSVLSTNVCDF